MPQAGARDLIRFLKAHGFVEDRLGPSMPENTTGFVTAEIDELRDAASLDAFDRAINLRLCRIFGCLKIMPGPEVHPEISC
ncbi:MAG: hypothetical protein V2B18_01175 [Pseudomonadota bacterium]